MVEIDLLVILNFICPQLIEHIAFFSHWCSLTLAPTTVWHVAESSLIMSSAYSLLTLIFVHFICQMHVYDSLKITCLYKFGSWFHCMFLIHLKNHLIRVIRSAICYIGCAIWFRSPGSLQPLVWQSVCIVCTRHFYLLKRTHMSHSLGNRSTLVARNVFDSLKKNSLIFLIHLDFELHRLASVFRFQFALFLIHPPPA